MIRSICLISIFCVFAGFAGAQERHPHNIRTERRALEISINARTLNEEQVVVWNETQKKIAIPGTPVGIKLVGSNVVVAVQFTPYIRRQGNVLVAQGQIWIENQGSVNYYTSIQTIPMDFNEPIYFFPLGTSNSSIEIIVTVNETVSEASSSRNEN